MNVVPFKPHGPQRSETFKTFHRAILGRQQITCRYQGHHREVCPHILGYSGGEEKALVYQFGGESSKGLPAGGEWRCLRLSEVHDVEVRSGRWHSGSGHSATQRCVETIYIDVNTAVPNQPGRR